MKEKALVSQDWDDLVFENRNKEYGAYALRKKYSVSVIEATMITIGLAVFIFLLPGIINRFAGKEVVPVIAIGDLPTRLLPIPEIIRNPRPRIAQPPVKTAAPRYVRPVVTTAVVDDVEIVSPNTQVLTTSKDHGTDIGSPDPGQGTVETSIAGVGTDVVLKEPDEPRTIVEFMPEYIGGGRAMMKFFGDHVDYPRVAKRIGLEGKVYVQFVIGKDGSVKDVAVIKGVSADLDREAVRLITMMPKWKPGRMGQLTVPVKMVLPVYFRLDPQ